jgi:hypothetical protein
MADAVPGSQPQAQSKADILFGNPTPAAPAPAAQPAATPSPAPVAAPIATPAPAPVLAEPAPATPPAAVVPPAQPVVPAPVEPAKATPEGTPAEVPPAAPAEPAKPVEPPKAPEKYELKLVQGSPITPERVARIEADAKAQGLTNEQAQAVVDNEHKIVIGLVSEHQSRIANWKQVAMNDKEIGGTDLPRNLELSKRVAERYGSPALIQELEATGFGSHPEVVKMFVRIGKAFGEDRLIIGGGSLPKGSNEGKTAADILFGDPEPATT